MILPIRLLGLPLALLAAGVLASGGDLRAPPAQPLHIAITPLTQGQATDPQFDAFYQRMVEALPPPQRAERLLELSINGAKGAADYTLHHAQDWRGQLGSGERLAAVIAVAMNSPRLEVRMAGFEVQLAQENLATTPQEAEHLIARLHEDPHGVGAWMLYHLGLLAARGVERARIVAVLVATSHAQDVELRQWAVEALALSGGADAIAPLLSVAANDASATIRERAFCGLAQSGTFHIAERYDAVPGLLAIATDPRADRQNVAWSYQALREITGIRDLPDDPVAWRARLRETGLLRGQQP